MNAVNFRDLPELPQPAGKIQAWPVA